MTTDETAARPSNALPTDTYDGYYWRDVRGRVLTTCSGDGAFVFVCGHPVPGGVYCGNFRGECSTHG